MGAQEEAQCVDQDVAPLDFLSQHGASIMRVALNPSYVGQGIDCIRNAYSAGYRIYLTLGGYSNDPQKAAAWYAQWVRFYENVAPLWAIGIENEPELAHDQVPAETPAQYRAVWDTVAPAVHQIAPSTILVFGEGSPWSENFIKLAWGAQPPQYAGAVGFHCYGIGLQRLPEFSAWAAQQNVPMWCSEETDWLDPAPDLARVLAVSPNTKVVVYYYWPKPPAPPPYLAPTELPPVLATTPEPPKPPTPTAPTAQKPTVPRIVSHPARRSHIRSATIRFLSSTRTAAYQCRRDRQTWRNCSSPKRYTGLFIGRHTFYVRATLIGRASTATRFSWTIVR
jgi:hypothetical protein